MPKLSGISHVRAVEALRKAGFEISGQGKHVVMRKGDIVLIIPRGNPIDSFTMGAIIIKAGMTINEFKKLL